jgi:ribokinase
MKKLSVLGIFVADLSFYGKIPLKGQTVLGDKFVLGPGGKGSNQAVAAGKSGANVNFISKIGNDDYGKMALKIYGETNVGIKNLLISDKNNTGVAAILLNKETGDNAISVIPGASGDLTLNDIDEAEDEIKNASFFLTQLECPMDVVVYALKIAKKHNVSTILNPAPAAKLEKDIFPLIDYFTPNETEASFYLGKKIKNKEDARNSSKDLLSLGIKNVIITLGANGVYFENKEEHHFIPSLDLGNKVKDTSGAGDAFNGAFAAALCENKSIEDALKFANTFAGISTTRIGTANSMPSRNEIDKLL